MKTTRIEKKIQPKSQHLFRKLYLLALFTAICLAGTTASAATSRLYPPSKDETGALRIAEVMQLAAREEILKLGVHLQYLLASGLKDSDLNDRSLAVARIYCCHESTERGTAIWFYVPPQLTVKQGDFVIVRMGRESTKKDPGTVNTAIEVRDNNDCSWDPPNEKMWTRVINCKWMPAEGWTYKSGLHNTWLKRKADATP